MPVDAEALGTIAPTVGEEIVFVGWGDTQVDAGDSGTKRSGTTQVTAEDALSFQVSVDPSLPCVGDSGGPAFAPGDRLTVLGITSHGDTQCASDATFTRVDAVTADFIVPTMAALGQGTVPDGGACMYDEQCAGGGPCVVAPDDANVRYCTSRCNLGEDCPAGMVCTDVGDFASQCRYPLPSPGAIGASCSSDADCVDAPCADNGVCAIACSPVDGTCPAGYACTFTGGIDFSCLAPPPTGGGGGCALAGSPEQGAALLLGGGAVLLVARRRRASRSGSGLAAAETRSSARA